MPGSTSSSTVVAEEVLLDPVGQARDADAEQPDASGGVEVLEQADGQPPIVAAASVGEPSVVERLIVVKSWSRTLMVTVRPASPLAAGVRRRCGLPREQRGHQPAVGEVGVVGALDAHRLGLALGDDRAVVAGVAELVEGVPVRGAERCEPARPR